MDRLRLTLFRGFQARVGTGPALTFPARKAEALLAYLALPLGRAHSRDALATLLWGGLGDAHARKSLRQALFTVRKVTGLPALLLDGSTVALDPTVVDVDVAEFERCLDDGTPAALEGAATLYSGDLLQGLAVQEPGFEDWLLAERERLREAALDALARLLAHQRDSGATAAAVATAVRLLSLDPVQEPVHRALMRLYVALDRRAAALRQYQVCVAALQRELGVEPDTDTKALYREILRHRSARGGRAGLDRPRVVADPAGGPAETLPRDIPLVGREPDLARLRHDLQRAWAGHGHVVALIGEAGVGKSRLIAELASEVPAGGGRVLLGRAYEGEEILSFGPWVDALRNGRLDADVEALDALGHSGRTELARLLPELGVDEAPRAPGDHRRLFESVAQVLRHLARRQPLLLILEDVHWADEMSLRLLAFIGRRLDAAPICTVATEREEDVAAAPVLGRLIEDLGRHGRLTERRLAPLSKSDTLALVRALAGSRAQPTTAAFGETVWQASEGNALVVVETVRARAAGPSELAAGGLPHRVQQLVSRHLRTLSDSARELASVAAVIGRDFEFALLARAAGLTDVEAAERLEELVRRRILQNVADGFDFTHDRVREVAYEALLPERRRALHARIVEAIETLHADRLADHVERLGRHALRGALWERAVSYLRRAGAKAAARSANQEAVACLEQALEALDRLPAGQETRELGLDIRYELDAPLMAVGHFERRLERFQEAERLAEELGDRRRLVRTLAWAAQNLPFIGRTGDAVLTGRRSIELLADVDDPLLAVVARQCLGSAEWEAGAYREAAARLRRNLDALEDADGGVARETVLRPLRAAVVSRYWLVLCLSELGEFSEAATHTEEARRLAEAWDTPWNAGLACRMAASLELRRGGLERALPAAARGLELCSTKDFPYMFPTLASLYGYLLVLSGRAQDGIELMERAQAVAREMKAGRGEPLRRAQLGEGYLVAGRIAQARDVGLDALDLAEQRGEHGYAAWAHRLLGEIHRAAGTAEAAERHYRAALTAAERLGMGPLAAHCHLGLGRLGMITGQPDAARDCLGTATAMFRALGMHGWLARADTEPSS